MYGIWFFPFEICICTRIYGIYDTFESLYLYYYVWNMILPSVFVLGFIEFDSFESLYLYLAAFLWSPRTVDVLNGIFASKRLDEPKAGKVQGRSRKHGRRRENSWG